ncbi:MAG TPA: hypothetical protein VGX28_16105 [Frankiaceae bacterium]|nr:hypothetical protein [Frankiaceae bacterium]
MTSTKRRGAVVATAAVAAVAAGTAAWAFYALSSNTDNATFTARSLAAPTGGTATVVSATSVTVSWTAPAAATQLAGAQYAVTNTVDGHAVCTVSGSTCSDTTAIPGVLNTYSVKAVLPSSSWASAAVSPSATPPPVFAVTNAAGGALSTQVAGTQFQVKVTAMKGSPLAADTTYSGARSVTFSGPSAAPNGTAPLVNGVAVGTASNVTFASGAATVNATLYRRETAVALTATTGAGATAVTGTSATFAVNAAGRTNLFFTSSSIDCSGGSVTVTRNTAGAWTSKVSVSDLYGNVVANTAAVTVSSSFPSGHTVASGSSLTIPSNASESTGSLSVTTANGNNTTRLLTSSAPGLTAATCSITGT